MRIRNFEIIFYKLTKSDVLLNDRRFWLKGNKFNIPWNLANSRNGYNISIGLYFINIHIRKYHLTK